MRTACVWLLVQNKARAEPWTSWDTTKIANASETAIRAHETAIMSAAPTRRALSGTLRISAPRKIRVTNCETAASATIIPTSTVLYPTAMANIGTTTARVPRANENNTVAAMLRILSAPDRPTVWPLQDDGTPPLGRSPVREPARRFLRRAGLTRGHVRDRCLLLPDRQHRRICCQCRKGWRGAAVRPGLRRPPQQRWCGIRRNMNPRR